MIGEEGSSGTKTLVDTYLFAWLEHAAPGWLW
jgi:hypothetical protein